MNHDGQRNRQRVLRHAAPERVRELLDDYRRRAARDLSRHSTRTGEVGSQATGQFRPRRSSSAR